MSRFAPDVAFTWVQPQTVPLPGSIYLDARYQSMLAVHDGCEARVLQCCNFGHTAWLPLLVRDLGQGVFEAYSAYGYGGFFGDIQVSGDVIECLCNFLSDDGIVALFLRHSPFVGNQAAMPDGLSRLNRYTYAVDLQPESDFAAYLMRLPQKLRWSANFALRAGLRVSFQGLSSCSNAKILTFYAQYRALMQAKGIDGYYLFSEQLFLEHARCLGSDCELAEVTNERGEFLGGAFFLLDDAGWTHYHLSAVPREALKLQAMELLILSAIYRYGNVGYGAMHLGGGHALDERDGLSRFKAKFATRKLEFHCSMLVCDDISYRHERSRVPLAHPGFFLIADARATQTLANAGSLVRPT